MSKSLLKFRDCSQWVDDKQLVIASYFMLQMVRSKKLPTWLYQYLDNVIKLIYEAKPVGWADFELDKYLKTKMEVEELISFINNCINELPNPRSRVSTSLLKKILYESDYNRYYVKESNITYQYIVDVFRKIIDVVNGSSQAR